MAREYRYHGTGETSVLSNSNESAIKAQIEIFLFANGVQPNYVVVTKQQTGLGFGDTYGLNLSVTPLLPHLEQNAEVTTAVKVSVKAVLNNVNLILSSVTGQPTTTNTSGNTSGNTYTVIAGDTLSRIAIKTNSTINQLISLNSSRYPSLRTNPNLINVGWVLYTSGNGAQQPTTQQPTTQQPQQPAVILPASQVPNILQPTQPKKTNFLADISNTFGVAPYVVGIAGVGVLLIVLTSKK